MKTTEIELPNGIRIGADEDGEGGELITSVTFRKLRGVDEDFLLKIAHGKTKKTDDGAADLVLLRAIESIGTETDPKGIRDLYQKLFLADLTYMLVQLRAIYYGAGYSFKTKCPGCGDFADKHLDLSTLSVDVRGEEERGLEVYRKVVETEEEKAEIAFRLLRIEDRKQIQHVQQFYKNSLGTHSLLLQLKEVNGVPADPVILGDMSHGLRNAIRQTMDDVCGGVDLQVVHQCDECSYTWDSAMPTDLRSFFFSAEGTSRKDSPTEKRTPSTPYRHSGVTLPSLRKDGAGGVKTSLS